MTQRPAGFIDLPAHRGGGGFDHAAVHEPSGRVYVAHTANDAVDVMDGRSGRYLRSVSGLKGAAGVLVSGERALVFTSNRGEDTVGIFPEGEASEAARVPVGARPNGLAFAPHRGILLAACLGDPDVPGSAALSFVDVAVRTRFADLPLPGRPRWCLADHQTRAFYVAIRDPPQIVVIDAPHSDQIARALPVPAEGPHGLDLDPVRGRLFCACDAGRLIVLNRTSGEVLADQPLSGSPDVVFFNPVLQRLYVAVGDPGVIDVFDTVRLERRETRLTERGAHTLALDPGSGRVYAFLPESHRAAVFEDAPGD